MQGRQRLSFCVLFISIFLFSCRKKDSLTTTPNQPTPAGYVQKPVSALVNANIRGFYEALPPGYDITDKKYPLLLFLHGGGELGNGVSDLPLVLKNAIPHMLDNKTFPISFTVHGETFSFVIISPQFIDWPVNDDVDAMINYSIEHYRINTKRLYMVGMSMGGAATWDYAGEHGKDLAAIVPICGANWADSNVCKNISLSAVPIWAFHNMDDNSVTVNSTTRYERLIKYFNPDYYMKVTLWPTGGHDAWTRATDPATQEDDKNIYEWMLQYKRG